MGGVADQTYGQTLERKNWNGTAEHNAAISSSTSNEARLQFGTRRFFEPTNSDAVAEWFSSGNTLMTGGNILGDLLGDGHTWEARDTIHHHFAFGHSSHDVKAGFSYQRVHERFRLDTYEHGLFIYANDTRAFPIVYAYGVGSSDVSTDTNIYGGFLEDARGHPGVVAEARADSRLLPRGDPCVRGRVARGVTAWKGCVDYVVGVGWDAAEP